MHEQAPSNLTPEQGWAQMRTILDREMPQERRSRRIIFFWWVFAAMAVLSTSGYLLWNTELSSNSRRESNTPVQEEPAKPAPVTSRNQGFADHDVQDKSEIPTSSSTSSTATSNTVQKGNGSTASTTENSKHIKSEKKDVLAMSESAGKQQSVISSRSISTGAPDQVNESKDQNTRVFSLNQTSQTPVLVTDSNYESPLQDKSTDQKATPAARNGQVILALPCLAISELEIPDAEIGVIEAAPNKQIKTVVKDARIKVNPFASAAALASWNGGGGMNAAAGLNVKGKTRLALQAGVGYGTFDPSLSFIKGDLLTADELVGNGGIVQNDNAYLGYENYIVGESLSTGNSYTALNPIVEHLNQWHGELGLSYDLSRRWFAQGGVRMSFNTRAYSQYPIINADINTTPTEVRASHSLDSYDVIRNTMTSVYGGIGFHIGKHFDLYTQVVYGFQPYLLTTETTGIGMGVDLKVREDYIRGVSLGLRYTL